MNAWRLQLTGHHAPGSQHIRRRRRCCLMLLPKFAVAGIAIHEMLLDLRGMFRNIRALSDAAMDSRRPTQHWMKGMIILRVLVERIWFPRHWQPKVPKKCEGVQLDRSEEPISYCAALQFHLLFAQHETRSQTVKAQSRFPADLDRT
jgi:hypothetical protein